MSGVDEGEGRDKRERETVKGGEGTRQEIREVEDVQFLSRSPVLFSSVLL